MKAGRGTLLPPANATGKTAFLPLPDGQGSSAGSFDNFLALRSIQATPLALMCPAITRESVRLNIHESRKD